MKKSYFLFSKLLLAGAVLWALGNFQASAQRTVVVDDGTYGNLNDVIAGDTTDDGARVDTNTIYVLKRDKAYLLNGALSFHFPLNIEAEEGEGAMPMIIPGVGTEGGESERPFRPRSDLHLKGLYITSKDPGGNVNSKMIRVSTDDARIIVEDCYLEYDGQSFVRLDGDDCTVEFLNCTLANLGQTSDPSNGRIIDDRGNDVDTVIFENCTIYNITHRVTRDDGGIMRYYRVNNNTIFNVGGPVFQIGEVITCEVYNNIVANYSFYGNRINPETGVSGYIFNVDTLGQDYVDQGYTQVVTVHNNNFYIDTGYTNLAIWGDSLAIRQLFDPTTQAFIDQNGEGTTNITENLDLSFKNPPVIQRDIVTKFWTLGPQDPGIPFFDLTGEPYDFSFADSAKSFTAGVEGSQLGDPRWVAYSPEGVFNRAKGAEIDIYPNPVSDVLTVNVRGFNNTIHIFNVIGSEVLSIWNVENTVRIPVSDLKDGIYFLTVENNNGIQGRVKFIKK